MSAPSHSGPGFCVVAYNNRHFGKQQSSPAPARARTGVRNYTFILVGGPFDRKVLQLPFTLRCPWVVVNKGPNGEIRAYSQEGVIGDKYVLTSGESPTIHHHASLYHESLPEAKDAIFAHKLSVFDLTDIVRTFVITSHVSNEIVSSLRHFGWKLSPLTKRWEFESAELNPAPVEYARDKCHLEVTQE